jgi:acetyl esterase/lipase
MDMILPKDGLVPPDQSEELYRKLTAKGVPCDLIVVKGAEHGDPLFYQDEVRKLVYDWLIKKTGIRGGGDKRKIPEWMLQFATIRKRSSIPRQDRNHHRSLPHHGGSVMRKNE